MESGEQLTASDRGRSIWVHRVFRRLSGVLLFPETNVYPAGLMVGHPGHALGVLLPSLQH
jgi:hypothetical protein